MEKKTRRSNIFVLFDNDEKYPRVLEIIKQQDGSVYVCIRPEGSENPMESQSVLIPKEELIEFLKESIEGL